MIQLGRFCLRTSPSAFHRTHSSPNPLTQSVTSHDTATVGQGNIQNQVAFEYDGFGQLTADFQSHDGPADANSPRVAYAYEDGSQLNTHRRKSMTYPNGQKVHWQYGIENGIDQALSRVSSLRVDGETQNLVHYTRAGAARYVKLRYAQPGVELSYIKRADEPTRDSGDIYTGYDRFGRTVDMLWQTNNSGEIKDRIQYGYDRAGHRTWRKDINQSASYDEHYGYDDLYQVTDFERGDLNLNQTAIGGVPEFEQHFEFDQTGNWNRFQTKEDGTETKDQSRVHNQDNQITQIDGSNEGILFDRAGNALHMPPGVDGDWNQYKKLTWDAWNRLVKVEDQDGNLVAEYQYDAATRRTVKVVDGQATRFYYNDLWKCVEERENASTDAKIHYFWGARDGHRDELIRRDRDVNNNGTLNESIYCLMDYYNPTLVVDVNGNVLERYQFNAFGKRLITDSAGTVLNGSSLDLVFAFHGEYEDAETDWHNYGYRYYCPDLGRWLSKDPIREEGGTNLYGFANNNSIEFVDVLGAVYQSKWLAKDWYSVFGDHGRGYKGDIFYSVEYGVRYSSGGGQVTCSFGPTGDNTALIFNVSIEVHGLKTKVKGNKFIVGANRSVPGAKNYYVATGDTIAKGREHEENHFNDFRALHDVFEPYLEKVFSKMKDSGPQTAATQSKCEACLWEEYDKSLFPRPEDLLKEFANATEELNKARDDWENLLVGPTNGNETLLIFRRSNAPFKLQPILDKWSNTLSSKFPK